MHTTEMFKIVDKNIDYINSQVSSGNAKAINLGLAYNMNMDRIDLVSLSIFEKAFVSWYEENKLEVYNEKDS